MLPSLTSALRNSHSALCPFVVKLARFCRAPSRPCPAPFPTQDAEFDTALFTWSGYRM